MPYTLFSRGRPMGVTELSMHSPFPTARCGWFIPNDDGERMLHDISANSIAMRDLLHRNTYDMSGRRVPHPHEVREKLLADLADVAQHLESLQLELRRDDGTVVPTSDIGLQDTVLLRQLAESSPADDAEGEVAEEDELLLGMYAQEDEGDAELDAVRPNDEWGPDESSWVISFPEEAPHERYQIFIQLPDDAAAV